MATRLYTSNNAAAVAPSSWTAAWDQDGIGSFACQETIPVGGSSAGGVAGTGTSGQFVAVWRYVSPPINAQTIEGTVKGVHGGLQVNVTDNYTLALAIKVIASDGTERGVLLQPTASTASAEEFTTGSNATSRKFRDSSDNDDIALSSLACSANDRIVWEIGFRTGSTSTANCTFRNNYLGDNGPCAFCRDVNLDSSLSPVVGSTWIQFSQDIAGLTNIPDIVLVGGGATPTDGPASAGTADPTIVAAIGSTADYEAGDLLLMIGHQRAASATLAVSEAGGQTWTSETPAGATNVTARLFWAVYNGSGIGGGFSVDFSATTCNSVQLFAFRPPSGYTWSVQQAIAVSSDATDPFTITGQTTTGTNPTLSFAGWFSPDDNTWGTLSGTNWGYVGSAQYRNTSGSDQSSTYAHQIKQTAGSTNNVSKSQLTLGADTAATFILTYVATPPAVPKAYRPFFKPLRVFIKKF